MLKIITAYTKNYTGIVNQTFPIIQNYCDYHGFSFCPYEIPSSFNRPPAWAKIQYLLTNLEDKTHRYLLWLDADTTIINPKFDPISLIEANKYIYLSKDFNNLNTGVMILKNNEYNTQLLYKIWSMTDFINSDWWEQSAFINLVDNNYKDIQSYIKYISSKEFNAYIPELNCDPQFIVDENSFVVHIAGQPLEYKNFQISHYSQHYKPIFKNRTNTEALPYFIQNLESLMNLKKMAESNDLDISDWCDLLLFRLVQNLRKE